MNTPPLPLGSSTAGEPGRRRVLALVVTSAAAMLAGLAVGYALGTVHACERARTRGDHHGV